MRFLKILIPLELQKDNKIYTSVHSIVTVDIVIMLIPVIFIPLFYFIDFTEGVYIMAYSLIAAIFYIVLLNLTKNLSLCGGYFTIQSLIVSLALMAFTGGISSPYLFWLIGICPVSFLFFKYNHGRIYSVITLTSFLIFAIAQIMGYPFEQNLSSKVFYITYASNYLYSILGL